jgi:putative ABC transport system substrate-binding protein
VRWPDFITLVAGVVVGWARSLVPMRRIGCRALLIMIAGLLLNAPSTALGQSRVKPSVIGIVSSTPASSSAPPSPAYDAFRQALRDLGHIEGQTIMLEPRRPAGWQFDDYLAVAHEFVRQRVDIIVASHVTSTLAAKQATQDIPIVFGAIGVDPIELGLAKSLARPGYNITGMSLQTSELPGKRLELIKQILPTATRIAILLLDIDTSRRLARDHEPPASAMGVELLHLEVPGPSAFEMAFHKAKGQKADAMVLTQHSLFYTHAKAIADLSLKYRLPVLSGDTGFAAVGGLINQGPDSTDAWRRSATLVDKILKGAKPGDLPIEQPTKFELVVNLKTAGALGVTIPPVVLIQADEVIE